MLVGRRGTWNGSVVLDDRSVPEIDGFLDVPGNVRGKAQKLKQNEEGSFQGVIVLGEGFVLEPELAGRILSKVPKGRNGRQGRTYADVLFPYMVGEDLNQRPDQSSSRFVINFHDWPWRRATATEWDIAGECEREALGKKGIVAPDYKGDVALDYPICARILRSTVKPFRSDNKRKQYRELWWIYGERRPGLQEVLPMRRYTIAAARVTEYLVPCQIKETIISSEATWLAPTNDLTDLLILHSNIHEIWARKRSSSLETRLRYSPSDCYETFPFPTNRSRLEPLAEPFLAYRDGLCRSRNIGLTDLYNLYHNPDCTDPEIETLRDWQRRIDRAVADSYNWHNFGLDYGYQHLRWGRRYTVDDPTRREILDRLLALNHQRHAEEVAAGLHDPDKPKTRKKTAGGGRKPKVAKAEGARPAQGAFDLDDFQLTAPPAAKPRRLRR